MSDAFNLAAVISMSPQAFEAWLDTPAVAPSTFDDWSSMFAGWYWAKNDVGPVPDKPLAKTVRKVLATRERAVKAGSVLRVLEHDGKRLLFFDMQLAGRDPIWAKHALSALRQAGAHLGARDEAFVVYWADIAGRLPKSGGVISLCRIVRSGSGFVGPSTFRRKRGALEKVLETISPAEQAFDRLASELDEEEDAENAEAEATLAVAPKRADAPLDLEAIVRNGDAHAFRAAVAHHRAHRVEEALAKVDFSWGDATANRNIWRLGPELIRYRPTAYRIAASLVASALDLRTTQSSPVDATQIEAVLAWARPFVRKTPHLSGQLSILATSRCYAKRVAEANAVFDYLANARVKGEELRAAPVATALFAALPQNHQGPADAARLQRWLREADAHPKDRFVQFNAACAAVVLGRLDEARQRYQVALSLGLDREKLEQDALFQSVREHVKLAPLRAHKVVATKRGKPKPARATSAMAGLLPP